MKDTSTNGQKVLHQLVHYNRGSTVVILPHDTYPGTMLLYSELFETNLVKFKASIASKKYYTHVIKILC